MNIWTFISKVMSETHWGICLSLQTYHVYCQSLQGKAFLYPS